MTDEFLSPCPFCGGPPVVTVQKCESEGGGSVKDEDFGRPDGMFAYGYVYCHECGAQGPQAEDIVCFNSCCKELEQEGIKLWQDRSNKNSDLFDKDLANTKTACNWQ